MGEMCLPIQRVRLGTCKGLVTKACTLGKVASLLLHRLLGRRELLARDAQAAQGLGSWASFTLHPLPLESKVKW